MLLTLRQPQVTTQHFWKPKILLMGQVGHGKRTVCKRLFEIYGLRYCTSSIRKYGRWSHHPTLVGHDVWEEVEVYSGVSDIVEYRYLAANKLFDLSIWVDAEERVQRRKDSGMTVSIKQAQYVIDNNGSLQDLNCNVDALMKYVSA
jgi:hypothetical protein